MKLTEREHINLNESYAYEVLSLAKNERKKFLDISDYLPFSIHESEIFSLNHIYQNRKLRNAFEEHESNLSQNSFELFKQISDPNIFTLAIEKIEKFKIENDRKSICTYFQRLPFGRETKWVLTHKSFCETDTFMTLAQPLNNLGSVGVLLRDILGETCISRNGWELFKTLTKREKEVMQLLAQGMTSREISDQLSISKFTVDTHRKHLFQKLEVKNYAELIKISQGFQLLDLEGKPYL